MSSRMTNWPKCDQYEAVSTTVSPVTHEAETAVKSAAIGVAPCPLCVAHGVMSRSAPETMRKTKLSTIIWNEESLLSRRKMYMMPPK